METHRTIEKSKETIVKRPNKVMGPATGLAGSMAVESLLILCYWTNMQQPAIRLITSNTAQVNFPT